LAEINPRISLPVGIFAYTPLFSVNFIGGQTGDGDGIGVAVFFTTGFFFFTTGFLLGVAFFVVAGLAVVLAVAFAVGFALTLGVGVAA
jgi:hypothetical protein